MAEWLKADHAAWGMCLLNWTQTQTHTHCLALHAGACCCTSSNNTVQDAESILGASGLRQMRAMKWKTVPPLCTGSSFQDIRTGANFLCVVKWHKGKFVRRGDSQLKQLTAAHSHTGTSCSTPSSPQAQANHKCATNPLMGHKMRSERENSWTGVAIFSWIKLQQRSGIWPSVNKVFHSVISVSRTEKLLQTQAELHVGRGEEAERDRWINWTKYSCRSCGQPRHSFAAHLLDHLCARALAKEVTQPPNTSLHHANI